AHGREDDLGVRAARQFGCTTTVPCSMSMPHEYFSSPACLGVNVIATVWLSGRSWSIWCSGITSSFAHVLSVLRVTSSVTGLPACTVTLWGSKPFSVTRIATCCVPAALLDDDELEHADSVVSSAAAAARWMRVRMELSWVRV